jgi:membrane protease YdiL (CAAX protease family)
MGNSAHDTSPWLIRLWSRLPIIVRAIVTGFFVFAIAGSIAWTLALSLVPAPWSILVMLAVLVVYWRYFSGAGWPESTQAHRRLCFRATKMPARVWIWSLVAAFAAALFLQAMLVSTFRIVEFPAETWALSYDFSALPAWQVWMLLVLAAFVAGITEEIGFRGYMQVPLEQRYGPAVAIGIVSIVFMVAHLNQAWAGVVIVGLIVISVLWGVLARASGSLIPGIISHGSTDVVNFSYWWTDVAGRFDRRPISETGVDTHFLASVSIMLLLLALFVIAIRKTLGARHDAETAGSV